MTSTERLTEYAIINIETRVIAMASVFGFDNACAEARKLDGDRPFIHGVWPAAELDQIETKNG